MCCGNVEMCVVLYFKILNNVNHILVRVKNKVSPSESGPCGQWQQKPLQWLDWRAGRHPCRSSRCNQTLFNALRARPVRVRSYAAAIEA